MNGSPSDERSTLLRFLRDQRSGFERRCQGLDAEQLARRSCEPSDMSLLGMLRHLADVERIWFRRRLAGDEVPAHFWDRDGGDVDWTGAVADDEVVEEAWRLWRDEVAYAERFVEQTADLGFTVHLPSHGELSLREVLVHMVEEYAQHNGHADLLRERIDGRTGW